MQFINCGNKDNNDNDDEACHYLTFYFMNILTDNNTITIITINIFVKTAEEAFTPLLILLFFLLFYYSHSWNAMTDKRNHRHHKRMFKNPEGEVERQLAATRSPPEATPQSEYLSCIPASRLPRPSPALAANKISRAMAEKPHQSFRRLLGKARVPRPLERPLVSPGRLVPSGPRAAESS